MTGIKDGGRATRRGLVLVAVILAMFTTAVEATIVATAVPSITADLGGFEHFSWVFAVFLLAQAISSPIYGKLADLYGRKPVYFVGTSLFLLGSALSGLSTNMPQLILFRGLQGIGAGSVQPISSTIVGDLYTEEERGHVQGYLSSVWGISSIIGPALGAFFVQYATWRLVFWVNIPLGIVSMALLGLFLHEHLERQRHSLDYWGAALLALAVGTLMLVLVRGESLSAQGFWLPSLLLAGAVALAMAFVWRERQAPEPMLPLEIWTRRVIAVGNSGSLVTGALLMGVTAYLPTYVQGVMGQSPTVAGFALAAMSVGWPLASTIGGRLMFRTSFRLTGVLGGFCLLLGAAGLITMSPEDGPLWAAAAAFLTGLGMGFTSVVFLVAIQSSVPWELRGVATASHMFMRMLGQAVGVALMGALLTHSIGGYLSTSGGRASIDLLMDTAGRSLLTGSELGALTITVAAALRNVYMVGGVLALLAFLIVWQIPPRIATSPPLKQ